MADEHTQSPIEIAEKNLNKLKGVRFLREKRGIGLEEAAYIVDALYLDRIPLSEESFSNAQIIDPVLAEAKDAIMRRKEAGDTERATPERARKLRASN